MAKLLYIKASPRGGRSHSLTAADAFVESYKTANPEDQVVTIDLFKTELPAFDGDTLDAKYAILSGKDHTPEQKDAWKSVENVIEVLEWAREQEQRYLVGDALRGCTSVMADSVSKHLEELRRGISDVTRAGGEGAPTIRTSSTPCASNSTKRRVPRIVLK